MLIACFKTPGTNQQIVSCKERAEPSPASIAWHEAVSTLMVLCVALLTCQRAASLLPAQRLSTAPDTPSFRLS